MITMSCQPPQQSLGQVKVDVEAVDHRVGEHAVDGGELTHQVEGDDDLRVFHLVLNHIHDDVQQGDAKVVMVKVNMRRIGVKMKTVFK